MAGDLATDFVIGRERERELLGTVLDHDGPLVAFAHGAAGIGKSVLLRALRADAAAAGAAVAALDCRGVEPTARGFLAEVGVATRRPVETVDQAVAALAGLADLVVLTVDTYELFRISDPWLRSTLVPALPEHVRVVLAGREPPIAAWLDARGNPSAFTAIRLLPLSAEASLEVLQGAGVAASEALAVNRVARGHPLALQVAVAALRSEPRLRVEEAAIPQVIDELTRLYVESLEPEVRQVLAAAAVVRRVTVPVLAAMLPDIDVVSAIEHLAALPFVEELPDGLRLHESVQAAVGERLRARDPDTYRRHRAAAWRTLRRDVATATRAQLWRYTADMLYLLENPAVREAFFPTTAHLYAVEAAQPADAAAVADIVARHEDPAAIVSAWWRSCPEMFRVVRDRSGAVTGLSVVGELDSLPHSVVRTDPVVAAWREHLARHPLPRGQRALVDRFHLSLEDGEAPSPVQASLWLDIKRLYMELRPGLGRLYSVVRDPAPFAEALSTLGFATFPGTVDAGGACTLLCLDFGPESVDGWLARLAAAELGVEPEGLLDTANRELVLDDRRVPLTPLEFGVLEHLMRKHGTAVPRAALLEQVWGYRSDGGSNVVDVVIRSLRQKLGSHAGALETVRGVGYRLRV